jgi:hypothetical protein
MMSGVAGLLRTTAAFCTDSWSPGRPLERQASGSASPHMKAAGSKAGAAPRRAHLRQRRCRWVREAPAWSPGCSEPRLGRRTQASPWLEPHQAAICRSRRASGCAGR